ncbi:hypothetical protein CXB51_029932 [Gossypium anomalum]|uniref:Uncharacterized protein n=1 Tax=Gossypium anomalum TaxID=47600 RepID=A0A8J5YFJ9_9ROSI|nr:hypothetical protein CXB51_029932 [Gossypium anomalum]
MKAQEKDIRSSGTHEKLELSKLELNLSELPNTEGCLDFGNHYPQYNAMPHPQSAAIKGKQKVSAPLLLLRRSKRLSSRPSLHAHAATAAGEQPKEIDRKKTSLLLLLCFLLFSVVGIVAKISESRGVAEWDAGERRAARGLKQQPWCIWVGFVSFGPGHKFGPTAAPLCSLSCNEHKAKILEGPNLPGLAESCLLCCNPLHLIASKRSVAASRRCDLL